jgi:hypothetical protein
MEQYKLLAAELRRKIQQALCVGPLSEAQARLTAVLDEYEGKISVFLSDEAARVAMKYIREIEEESAP